MVPDQLEPDQIKHLEMVQAVIARLAADSFLIKGWTLALSSAFFGFGVNGEEAELPLLALVPILALWTLDTYFLRSERLFRALYDAVRTGRPEVEPFFMGATSAAFLEDLADVRTTSPCRWRSVAFSVTLCWFYALLAVTGVVLAILLSC